MVSRRKMTEISQKILNFYGQLEGDKNHRYKSWEHCYAYFCKKDAELDAACLHLAFYLASWGMYRGSSFLLWKDYLIHKEVVSHLLLKRNLQGLDPASVTEETFDEIFNLLAWIKIWYQENIEIVNGASRSVNVTDTLATKIMLGTLGCIPAYDRYFIAGLRNAGLTYSGIRRSNFNELIRFYNNNKSQFFTASEEIKKNSAISYPAMKLLDMYFWEVGYESDQRLSTNA